MQRPSPDQNQSILFNDLKDLLDPKDPLYRLAAKVPWDAIENQFASLYSHTGRPAKPARLMVALLMLKHLFDLSDEQVVDRWRQNPYYQYFSGTRQFQWGLPCDPTDLVHFRKRIEPSGAEDILKWTMQMSGKEIYATMCSKNDIFEHWQILCQIDIPNSKNKVIHFLHDIYEHMSMRVTKQ